MMNLMANSTEVSSKAHRRRFTTAEKIRILREADACARETGGVCWRPPGSADFRTGHGELVLGIRGIPGRVAA